MSKFWALAFLLALTVAGCSSNRGPLTVDNWWHDFPSEVKSVDGNVEASFVTVNFQPWNAEIGLDGWYVSKSDQSGTKRKITLTRRVLSGTDNTNGKAFFVIESIDRPYDWHGNALSPDIDYYWMVTIDDSEHSGRIKVEIWRTNGKTTEAVSRGVRQISPEGYDDAIVDIKSNQLLKLLIPTSLDLIEFQDWVEENASTEGGGLPASLHPHN